MKEKEQISEKSTKEAVASAIAIAGGQTRLAWWFGVSSQAVQHWEKKGRIPAGRVLMVERITGVHRSKLRPDIYPPGLEKKRMPRATNATQCCMEIDNACNTR